MRRSGRRRTTRSTLMIMVSEWKGKREIERERERIGADGTLNGTSLITCSTCFRFARHWAGVILLVIVHMSMCYLD